MKHGPGVFLGVFFALACSFALFLLAPQLQLGSLVPTNIVGQEKLYPAARPGAAQQGAQVYRANGCYTCHSQQVRPRGYGADYDRGWGKRRSVARDYVLDESALLGSLRIGPDLANIGVRSPGKFAAPWSYAPGTHATNAVAEATAWHLLHLYNPRIQALDSTMPAYTWLFEKRVLKPGQKPAADALVIPATFAPEKGIEIVPLPSAHALVAYLLSLHSEASLPELEVLAPKPRAAPAGTNAPAVSTNAPAAPKP